MSSSRRPTVWVFGDQLNRELGALRDATPASHRVLMIESHSKLTGKRWHRQRAHFVVASMRRFADELRESGFEVDYRVADSMRSGHTDHVAEFAPTDVLATEPASWDGIELATRPRCQDRPVEPVPLPLRRVRRVGERAQAAQDGRLLPLAATTARLPDGRRRAGDRPLELRRREPSATAEERNAMARTATVTSRRPRPRRARRSSRRLLGRRARRHLGDHTTRQRWSVCATSSTRCCRCSGRTRTPWSSDRGISPTPCCRRT